jgi:putative hydrolase of the HAD superfamily
VRLAGRYRLILGSNTNPVHARQFKPQFAATLQHFKGLVLSHEIGARKPRPEFFRQVLAVSASPAARCVFVDDLPDNIAGARACGLHGIVYTGMDALQDDLKRIGVIVDDA